MKFLLGLFVGYSIRGQKKALITVLTIMVGSLIVFSILVPAAALTGIAITIQRERRSRPPQTTVPSLKGLTSENAEIKLREAKLRMRVLAIRYGLPIQPGLVIDQNPQPGEKVIYDYPVGVTITKADPPATYP